MSEENERIRLRKYTEDNDDSVNWVKENLDESPCNINPLIKRIVRKLKRLEQEIEDLKREVLK